MAQDLQPFGHFEGHLAGEGPNAVSNFPKALYDSYHRDAINHCATDKLTNLELRVVREQVEGMNGVLKWIPSERQFGDGLTKIAARQLLCDPLRHGAIKFTFAERKEPE